MSGNELGLWISGNILSIPACILFRAVGPGVYPTVISRGAECNLDRLAVHLRAHTEVIKARNAHLSDWNHALTGNMHITEL